MKWALVFALLIVIFPVMVGFALYNMMGFEKAVVVLLSSINFILLWKM